MRLHMNPRYLAFLVILISLVGCKSQQASNSSSTTLPDYSKPLPDGTQSLQKLPMNQWPDLGKAWDSKNLFLNDALDESIQWFDAPSSKQWFPMEGVTHTQAKESVIEFNEILETSSSKKVFLERIEEQFDVYASVGCDGEGTVLFTGYYSPDFKASATPTNSFNAALYQRPNDLKTDSKTGTPLGRLQEDGTITSWPTRAEIESENLLQGTELVWVKDALDAYTIHVNGSARLRMDDGTIKYIGYAGKTDRPYTGLGYSVIDAGLIPPNKISLRAIRKLYNKSPSTITPLIHKNESYVFFREYDGGNWPAGSLGVPVTAKRSVATDKKIFPRGGIVLVDTNVKSLSGDDQSFVQFMMDQDTGGAIRAPGRADLFMGVGATAGIKAGGQFAEGQLYYIFLKSDAIASVQD